ncbi:MAG: replicative DNA helicase [Isosphaeraceae bacterium]|nr:replicative DNA helicase [Isosphaeraceae bacterium]
MATTTVVGPRNGSGGSAFGDSALLGDRLPPQNLEAEQGVLGSVLMDNDVLHDVIPILKPEHFYRDSHQTIYRAIREVYDQARAIDLITLEEELRRRGDLEKVGGMDALFQILHSVPHAANAKYYAQIVHQKAVCRELIHTAHELLREGYSNEHTAEELLASAERRVFAIAEDQVSGDTIELRDVITDAMTRIDARVAAKHPLTGLSTGYLDLDDITGGFHGSQLVILAARPSMGKTAIALNICENVALVQKKAILFVSLEMGKLELAERLLCARARVDGGKLRTGKGLLNSDMIQLSRAYSELRESSPILIDDTPARNMLQITANARRLKLRHDLGLVVVDYIQLIDAEESRDSRQEQIAKISRRLKTLARELDVPVIALSQLNRAVESREDRRPRMADLRESGAIEQDADLILLLHRPEYYDPNDSPGMAEVIVAKNRNGATGTARLTFLRNITRFENSAGVVDPINAEAF